MNRKIWLNNFFRKWTDLAGHTHMQKEGLPKYHASPSLFPSVIATTCPRSLHTHSTERFSWLKWVLPPSLMLKFAIWTFELHSATWCLSTLRPFSYAEKVTHLTSVCTAHILLVLSKPIYTGILNIVTKEQWLNWKRNGLNTIANLCVGSRCL